MSASFGIDTPQAKILELLLSQSLANYSARLRGPMMYALRSI